MYDFNRKPLVYLVRHGETELNASNLYRGWENPPLNADGVEAAEEAGNYFSYERIGQVVSSDLIRAMQTADIILPLSCNFYVDLNPMVRPWHIGSFSGEPKNTANKKALQYFIDNPDEEIPNGESLTQFQQRWSDVLHNYMVSAVAGEPTVIICHTSNITATHQMCSPDTDHSPESHDIIEPGGIVALYLEADGSITIEPKLGAVVTEVEPEAS
jgi:broad specificity phosphatase PhoE